jgi:hypothetical protein
MASLYGTLTPGISPFPVIDTFPGPNPTLYGTLNSAPPGGTQLPGVVPMSDMVNRFRNFLGTLPPPRTTPFPEINALPQNMRVLMALNPQTRSNISNLINRATTIQQQFPQLFSPENLSRFPALATLNALANPTTQRLYF